MRLLWITERFPPDRGGAAASAGRQTAALAERVERLDVVRLTSDLAPGRVALEERGELTVHRVGRSREDDESLQLLAATAANLIAAHRHDVVHGFYAVHAGYVAVGAAREAGLPSVVSVRGNDLDRARFHGPRLAFLLWTLERADALVLLSEEMRRRVRALTDRSTRVRVVANGVDGEVFRPDGPAADLPDAPRPWFGFAGELRLKKGLPLLEDLASLLDARRAGTLFWIGGRRGDGAPAPGRVRELPYVEDPASLAALYRAMDVMVFPSLWDGMPNAVLESMACGRPVVASAVGAIPEMIRHCEDGFLVAPERLHAFAVEALRISALPAATLRDIGVAARARVLADFSPGAECDELLSVYGSLVR